MHCLTLSVLDLIFLSLAIFPFFQVRPHTFFYFQFQALFLIDFYSPLASVCTRCLYVGLRVLTRTACVFRPRTSITQTGSSGRPRGPMRVCTLTNGDPTETGPSPTHAARNGLEHHERLSQRKRLEFVENVLCNQPGYTRDMGRLDRVCFVE